MKKTLSALVLGTLLIGAFSAEAYDQWQGYCANRTNAYDNAELTVKPGVQYVGAGDHVTVLDEWGNAYLVRYPLINGKTKDRWVPKSAISGKPSSSGSAFVAGVQKAVQATVQAVSFQEWEGICANRTNAYDNAELTVKPGVQYVGAGDKVTVLQESGNAYLVRYPLINGKTKDRWVPKSAITRIGGSSRSDNAPTMPANTIVGSAPTRQETTVSFQEWEGICANRTNAYDNAELTVKPGVQYVGAGDKVTVLQESGNAYLVRYPLINGKTKEKWVPKSAISGKPSTSNSGSTAQVQEVQQQTVSYQEWEGYCAQRTDAYDNPELTQKVGVQYVGAGDNVTVLGESGNSYFVRYPLINGKTKEKWVPKSAITRRDGGSYGNSSSINNVKEERRWVLDCFNQYIITTLDYYTSINNGGPHSCRYKGKGVDIGNYGIGGKNVYSPFNGTVESAGWDTSGFGNLVTIKNKDGVIALFAHLSAINVSAGQQVSGGTIIGKVGNTTSSGKTMGNHLHYEFSDMNPYDYYKNSVNFVFNNGVKTNRYNG